MIIFGTRGVRSRVREGVFYCPHCQTRTSYALVEPKQYFHLFFIPLIPINSYDPYVECQRCGNTYRPEVLAYDPARARDKLLADYGILLLRAMLVVATAQRLPSQQELEWIRTVYAKATGIEVETDKVQYLAGVIRADGQPVRDDLSRLAPQLSEEGRERIVRACILTAFRNGLAPDTERYYAQGVALALGMLPAHFRGLLDDMFPRLYDPDLP